MSLNWFPSSKFCASSAHMGWGAAILLATFHHEFPLWLVTVLFVAYAVVKEYWADLTWLEQDNIVGSTLDFITYIVGGAIGALGFYHVYAGIVVAIVVLVFMTVLDMNNWFNSL